MSRLVVLILFASVLLPGQSKNAGAAREKFNTDLVRVLIANSAPGTKSRPHKHDVNRVMVYLDDGAQQLKFADGKVADQSWKAGDAIIDPAGGMHTSENKHSKPFRIVEIELKKPGIPVTFPKLDPVKLDPNHHRVLAETDQVRVVRIRLAAGDRIPFHEHTLPRVVVYLSDYHIVMTTADGTITETKGDAGDVVLAGPAKQAAKNQLSRFTEIVMVEIKAKPGN
jgi:quercetin dioxygenase-like cupin family protein